ncbi:MAG: phosphoribosylanthranilate isomerase [Candidatus Competibacteraceae bacterium]|nr:phosphoribosylanthranilate isomerase [Candidatus Competibacteraceae bacterium]
MARTRIKVCGITRPEDGRAAAGLGVDAIGLVFYPKSSRLVDIPAALRIIEALPPFVTTVGLFLDAPGEEIQGLVEQVPLDILQFHGSETPDFCACFGRPYLKAVPMGGMADVADYARRFHTAQGLLLDSHGGGRSGGSGEVFDWNLIPPGVTKPLILAGGLDPDNVAEAVAAFRPYGVDVSSGVESARGIKDPQRIAAFLRGVERGESRD